MVTSIGDNATRRNKQVADYELNGLHVGFVTGYSRVPFLCRGVKCSYSKRFFLEASFKKGIWRAEAGIPYQWAT